MAEFEILMAAQKYGLGFASGLALLFLVIWIVRSTFERLKGHEKWMQEFVETHIRENTEISNAMLKELKAMYDSTKEAHRHQREEHKEMVAVLHKLNGKTSR